MAARWGWERHLFYAIGHHATARSLVSGCEKFFWRLSSLATAPSGAFVRSIPQWNVAVVARWGSMVVNRGLVVVSCG